MKAGEFRRHEPTIATGPRLDVAQALRRQPVGGKRGRKTNVDTAHLS